MDAYHTVYIKSTLRCKGYSFSNTLLHKVELGLFLKKKRIHFEIVLVFFLKEKWKQ